MMLFGWLYLTPLDYTQLSKHVASSIGFVSNMIYMSESGYFDVDSKYKWLLHTWSLSVEWQFYMIYPVFVFFVVSIFSKNGVKSALLGLTVISFIFSILSSYLWELNSYYLLPSRVWQMGVGALAFLYFNKYYSKFSERLFFGGMFLILLSYFLFDEGDPWPGYLSVVPCFGAFLIIIARSTNSFITNGFLQFVGYRSYSIYLWHWPIVVLFSYLNLESPFYAFLGLIVSILFGDISYRYVENLKWIKAPKYSVVGLIFYPPSIAAVLIISFGTYVYVSDGLKSRFPDHPASTIERSPMAYECNSKWKDPCELFNKNGSWAVIGNSHAVELSYALAEKVSNYGDGVKQYTKVGCTTAYNISESGDCSHWEKKSVASVISDEEIKNVLVSYRITSSLFGDNISDYPSFPDKPPSVLNYLSKEEARAEILKSFSSMLRDLAIVKDKVYVVLPIPELYENINRLAFRNNLYDDEYGNIYGTSLDYYLERNALVREYLLQSDLPSNVHFIDPKDTFCDDISCYSFKSNVALYFDDDHPSLSGAKLIVDDLLELHLIEG